MKALDIVRTPLGSIGVVKETQGEGRQASIIFINGFRKGQEKNAWWHKEELVVTDSLPRLLARAMAHPFGNGEEDVNEFFKLNK